MSLATQSPSAAPPAVEYPDSDGEPMADNTLQFEWIVTIKEGLETAFRNDPDVFVAGDLLWYPVEGDNKIRAAPDAMVVFGRPKGHRGSYRQWEEGGIAPQVVFEILSPGNRAGKLVDKFRFYDRYGVEEYYVYDPETNELTGWTRQDGALREVPEMQGWTSPRLNVRFVPTPDTLQLIGPDGQPFLTYLQLVTQRDAAQQRADAERQRADAEQQRADAERQRAEAERQRAERLAAQLRALGVEPES